MRSASLRSPADIAEVAPMTARLIASAFPTEISPSALVGSSARARHRRNSSPPTARPAAAGTTTNRDARPSRLRRSSNSCKPPMSEPPTPVAATTKPPARAPARGSRSLSCRASARCTPSPPAIAAASTASAARLQRRSSTASRPAAPRSKSAADCSDSCKRLTNVWFARERQSGDQRLIAGRPRHERALEGQWPGSRRQQEAGLFGSSAE